MNGCRKNHHQLLHELTQQKDSESKIPVLPWEGATPRSHTTCNNLSLTKEVLSLRTVPVWLKANGRKLKVNALLDDGSSETFINEEVVGVLGLRESYETVKVHVLNNEVKTFQSIPVSLEIESVNEQYRKEIKAKSCAWVCCCCCCNKAIFIFCSCFCCCCCS